MKVMVTGITRLWPGILNPATGLRAKGVETLFFYLERHPKFTREDAFRVVRTRRRYLTNLVEYFALLRREAPTHVDFYFHTGRWNTLALQALITRRLGIPIVSVCTGAELLKFARHSARQQRAMRGILGWSRAVVVKELYMHQVIETYGLAPPSRVHFCSNKITAGPEPSYERKERNILFLNLFKEYRRVDLIIESAPFVVERFPGARFVFVGAGRNLRREAEYAARVGELGLTEKVAFVPYTSEVRPYLDEAAIFLLPADIVFCNNALLEAMERGVPPIVADVPGAERIVSHGVSGLRVPQEAGALARAMIDMLSDEAYRLRLARGAREKILREFREEVRADFLLDLYNREVWPHAANGKRSAGPGTLHS